MKLIQARLDALVMTDLEWQSCYVQDEIANEQARCAAVWATDTIEGEWPESLSAFVRTWAK
jgi:hypothetical protein